MRSKIARSTHLSVLLQLLAEDGLDLVRLVGRPEGMHRQSRWCEHVIWYQRQHRYQSKDPTPGGCDECEVERLRV